MIEQPHIGFALDRLEICDLVVNVNQAHNSKLTSLRDAYFNVRQQSLNLAKGLSEADVTVQSMPDASPTKWHLAHTTWFFETLILLPKFGLDSAFDPAYGLLFNSYYETLGARHPRANRGMLTQPSLEKILSYRAHVDEAMDRLLCSGISTEEKALVTLGMHHEQQHQELLLTDILHLFAQNPLCPVYKSAEKLEFNAPQALIYNMLPNDGGVVEIGHIGDDFAFDCEGPRHETLIRPYRIANCAITNGEWIRFIEDGGYNNPLLWLSDGWAHVQGEGWQAPGYWQKDDGIWHTMTLRGFQPVNDMSPVCHVSYFEADAFARWSGKRLPTETEWENSASKLSVEGNFVESGYLCPTPAILGHEPLVQMYGDVWEWTQSPFSAYPGFKPLAGAVSEYNGKFMSGQYVLRGGSCVTPGKHIRATYRNFFQPEKRWQFSGLRLAEDF